MNLESDVFQAIPPIFQPLRLWTPRVIPACSIAQSKAVNGGSEKKSSLRTFSMRGGFISTAKGERRLMIVGKMFRNLG